MSTLLPTFDLESPEKLYSSLVSSTHDFFTRYVIKSHSKALSWTLDSCIIQAERKAVEDGLTCQRQPTPDTLHQYQLSSDSLVALQQCVHTETWHKFTNIINH